MHGEPLKNIYPVVLPSIASTHFTLPSPVVTLLPYISVGILGRNDFFLIDTGSTVSILKSTYASRYKLYPTPCLNFRAVNGTELKIHGQCTATLEIGTQILEHIFFVADIDTNIIGNDILQQHNIFLNMGKGQLTYGVDIVDFETVSHSRAVNLLIGGVSVSHTVVVAKPNPPIHIEPQRLSFPDLCSLISLLSSSLKTFSNIVYPVVPENSTMEEIIPKNVDLTINLDKPCSKNFSPEELHERYMLCMSVSSDIMNNKEKDLAQFKIDYPEVFSNTIKYGLDQPIMLHINLDPTIPYKNANIYKVPEAFKEVAKAKIMQLLDDGIIYRSQSRYASPLICVPKKNGTLRVCVDYRRLNFCTIPDNYCIPRIDSIKNIIRGNIFSALDLKEGFMQLLVNKADREKTAVATPWGLFEFKRMPFGLRNSPPTFQRFMDHVCEGLENVLVYIDDIIIYSKTYEEHLYHLKCVFDRLKKFGLILNVEKSIFFQPSITYLGLEFNSEGYKCTDEKIPPVENFPVPTDKKEILKFMGLINYYRAHLPNIAEIATPMYNLTHEKAKFIWDEAAQNAFDTLKKLFKQRMVLQPYEEGGTLDLYTDASDVAIGAVLMCNQKPIEFFSKKLSPVEQRYSAHEREALGMVLSIQHFRHQLTARKFVLHTDHRPLTYWLDKAPVNERHARWMVKVQDMNFKVEYIAGKDNVLADLMSRPDGVEKSTREKLFDDINVNAVKIFDESDAIRLLQTEDFMLTQKIKPEYLETVNGLHFFMKYGNPLLVLPDEYRQRVISATHELGHYGQRKTIQAIKKLYWWRGMSKDITHYVVTCTQCQRNKKARVPTRVYRKFPQTSRFKTIHMDLVGPLPVSNKGNIYMLTIMDRFSRWIEAIPLRNQTADTVCEKFYAHWICRFGIPDQVITDQGQQFESGMFNSLINRLGCVRSRTTAYHPQTNGLIERCHSTLKNMLRCLSNKFPDWEKALPSALYAMRTAITNIGTSPSLLVYGEQIAIPGKLLSDDVHYQEGKISDFVVQIQADMDVLRQFVLTHDEALREPTEFENQEVAFPFKSVWLRDPIMRGSLEPKYKGPFDVILAQYPVITINMDGKPTKVNVDRLRPAFTVARHVEEDVPIEEVFPQRHMVEEIPILDPPNLYENLPELPRDLDENELVNLNPVMVPPVQVDDPILGPRLSIMDRRAPNPGGNMTGSGRITAPPQRYV